MKTVLIALLSVACLASLPLSAQQKEPASPVASIAPAKAAGSAASAAIPASLQSVNAILKAEHELDLIKNDEADVSQQFQALQHQADVLNPRFKEDQVKQAAAQAKVNAALEAVYEANGVTKDKYNFDPANFTLTPKPAEPAKAATPAPATTAAAKTPSK